MNKVQRIYGKVQTVSVLEVASLLSKLMENFSQVIFRQNV